MSNGFHTTKYMIPTFTIKFDKGRKSLKVLGFYRCDVCNKKFSDKKDAWLIETRHEKGEYNNYCCSKLCAEMYILQKMT